MTRNSQTGIPHSGRTWERIDSAFCRVACIERSIQSDVGPPLYPVGAEKFTHWWLVSDDGDERFPIEAVLQGLVGADPIRVVSATEPPFGQWRII